MPYVARTFDGLPGEADWVAMREIVPAATATVTIRDSKQAVQICSLLPGGGCGLVRTDGQIWVGLQVSHNYGDISRDLAHAIEIGQSTDPGNAITMTAPVPGPRLQDILELDGTFDVQVHDGFDYWIAEEQASEQLSQAIAEANDAVAPTQRLTSVDGAYRTTMGEHTWLRWVQPHDEDATLDALARLRSSGADTLGPGNRLGSDNRLIGSFRAHGLIVPVWELDPKQSMDELEEAAAQFEPRFAEALADSSALDGQAREARKSLANRQLTLR